MNIFLSNVIPSSWSNYFVPLSSSSMASPFVSSSLPQSIK